MRLDHFDKNIVEQRDRLLDRFDLQIVLVRPFHQLGDRRAGLLDDDLDPIVAGPAEAPIYEGQVFNP